MLGREHHVSAAVKCVGPRRENADFLFATFDFEIDFCAFTAANPIALKEFNSFRPIQCAEFIKQSLRKFGDAQHPLPHGPPNNWESADLTFSIDDFFIRQNGAEL